MRIPKVPPRLETKTLAADGHLRGEYKESSTALNIVRLRGHTYEELPHGGVREQTSVATHLLGAHPPKGLQMSCREREEISWNPTTLMRIQSCHPRGQCGDSHLFISSHGRPVHLVIAISISSIGLRVTRQAF